MPIYDIAHITKSIIRLIDIKVKSEIGNQAVTLPLPPDRMTADGLSFFLYHVQENAHYKNLPAPGKDTPPVRFTPMALNLYYQLSANHIKEPTSEDIYFEQRMMSVAMKALHDYPEITDKTMVGSVYIMESALEGKDNRFKISMQPIPYNEAVHYWTAGTSPLKLAAYYEVSVVLLEPEEPKIYAGRVMLYGTYIFTEGAPRISGSQNIVSFKLPNETTSRQVTIQPAQVAPGSPIDFFGTGFQGDAVKLLLRPSGPTDQVWVADTPWNVQVVADNQLTAVVRETAKLQDETTDVDVLPGLYAAQISVVRRRTLPNGAVREFRHDSNQFPFSVVPRVDSILPVNGIFTVTGYIDPAPDPDPDSDKNLDIQVYAGENRLTRKPTGGTLNPGEFSLSAPDASKINTMKLNPLVQLASQQSLPLRIMVAGAEAGPMWITAP
ncbi:MAG TPA: DUF4255 domain-containing protein [Saprospiraceae bacterium]|nr:DUF4255 domain-containing protein [Saprospiraceae bacterium]